MTVSKENQGKKPAPLRVVDEGATGKTGVSPEEMGLDPEVLEAPVRRRFTAEYKLRILKEVDECRAAGEEVGALLRREGLYSSHLAAWRKAREQGELAGLEPRKRGVKPKAKMVSAKEHERVKREKIRLERELEKARAIIEVQKKLSEMLGIELNSPEDEK